MLDEGGQVEFGGCLILSSSVRRGLRCLRAQSESSLPVFPTSSISLTVAETEASQSAPTEPSENGGRPGPLCKEALSAGERTVHRSVQSLRTPRRQRVDQRLDLH